MSRTVTLAKGSGIALALIIMAACGGSPSAQKPAPSSAHSSPANATAIDLSSLTGRIVFSGGPGQSEDVYIVNADGLGLHRLTRDPHADFDPALSPDGNHVAYRHQDQDDSSTEVWVVGDDGSGAHNVSHQAGADWGPNWSPDGKVVWNCQRDLDFGFEACVANADGTGLKVIHPEGTWVEYPAWSPDGTKIAFMAQEPGASGSDPNYDIFIMNADGSNVHRLTDAPGEDGWPAWSPDGTRITFSTTRSDCRNTHGPDCRSTGDVEFANWGV